MDVLISGAGIAGPALAHWLARFGFSPTVVERAPSLREGGQAVDFRGEAHLSVLRRMGVLDAVVAARTSLPDMVFRDPSGRERCRLPASYIGGEVEIRRGDLSRILYEASVDDTEYVFGDWITSLHDDGAGVDVTFANGRPRRFGFVIGADGMRSGVRRLIFPEYRPKFQGYYFALWDAGGNDRDLTCAPGVTTGSGWLMFRSSVPPELMPDALVAPGVYFDSISQVRMPTVSSGRVTLIGDAGYGSTLGGMGTGLAVVSAYVLAGEMAAGGDAFARYEALIGPYARGCQGSPGRFLAPATRLGMWARDRLFGFLPKAPMFARIDLQRATAITLPEYVPAR
ncbi:FAD-dependent monooxygenase [Lentzea flava]|uniref:FAD-dependent oxidoreductase n=1 Tax=Lentzea flava TaxID=103732 RepID=A0ABQ2USM8_9PSEU|nr:FAD-dependent monooxygenase [Lentzea flava]MCP2201369.1 2-polyprenyl-6-methoxyphenol hydroxylase [Lentzea flava]GGU51527.1 FAD-dependent oxidoreductase [Lentzea flava]